jgi:hypothetical protein
VLGSTLLDAARFVQGYSFPWPLPVDPAAEGPVCSNTSRIDLHLCCPAELEVYYRYLLLTDDPEKVPDTAYCSSQGGEQELACTPGFFDAALDNRVAPVVPQEAHACCGGYLCPPQVNSLGHLCPPGHLRRSMFVPCLHNHDFLPAPPPTLYSSHACCPVHSARGVPGEPA